MQIKHLIIFFSISYFCSAVKAGVQEIKTEFHPTTIADFLERTSESNAYVIFKERPYTDYSFTFYHPDRETPTKVSIYSLKVSHGRERLFNSVPADKDFKIHPAIEAKLQLGLKDNKLYLGTSVIGTYRFVRVQEANSDKHMHPIGGSWLAGGYRCLIDLDTHYDLVMDSGTELFTIAKTK